MRVRAVYVRMCIFVSVMIIDDNMYMYLYICLCKRMCTGVPLFVCECLWIYVSVQKLTIL